MNKTTTNISNSYNTNNTTNNATNNTCHTTLLLDHVAHSASPGRRIVPAGAPRGP